MDGCGRIIYDSDSRRIGTNLTLTPPELPGSGEIVSWEAADDGDDSLCFVSGFQQSDWRMVVTIPKTVLFQEADNTIRLIRSITFPAMILAILFFILLSLNITRPLKKLVLLLDEVEQENFDVQFHVKYNDEVSKVGKSFNFMVRKIRQLIKEVYATKLLYKQTELNALQSQINPHLSTIPWKRSLCIQSFTMSRRFMILPRPSGRYFATVSGTLTCRLLFSRN